MYAKLAFRNLRRSLKDYGVYFLTLLFGVAVFYAFNSIGDQRVLFDLKTQAATNIFEMSEYFLTLFSWVVAFVLGFLILYANRFLIRRRKKEFGTYLVLGMSPFGISRIVLYETFAVGLASLAIGLILGLLLSQGLSFVTAALLGTTMSRYQFLFSENAFLTTIICFLIIYALVAVLNLFTVGRTKLIDLLQATQANEKLKIRRPWLSALIAIASLGLLAWAYVLLIGTGTLDLYAPEFQLATILMVIGTLLLFWSGSSLIIMILRRIKGRYYRGLSMFTLRQVTSKVNTAFLSLWAVCLMLFFAITVCAVGFVFIDLFVEPINRSTLYDLTIKSDIYRQSDQDLEEVMSYQERSARFAEDFPDTARDYAAYGGDMAAKIADLTPEWNALVEESAQLDVYGLPGMTLIELLERSKVDPASYEPYRDNFENQVVTMCSASQFNAVASLVGAKTVSLGDDEYAVNNTIALADAWAACIAEEGLDLEVAGHALRSAPERLALNTSTSAMDSVGLELIVPDAVIESLKSEGCLPLYSYLDLMTKSPEDATILAKALGAEDSVVLDSGRRSVELWPASQVLEAEELREQSAGLRFLITYLALYIGLIFLVSTAAMLAIQQLSETSDSLPRYHLLSELGCDRKMIYGSLRSQICLYFLAPLLVALCHASCAIAVTGADIQTTMGIPVAGPAVLAVTLLVLIYGGYLLITYYGSRSMVRGAIKSS